MLSKAIKFLSAVFTVIWMIIIFSEYWRYNPNYSISIELFQYYDLLILFIGLGVFISWFIKKPRKKEINYVNGLSIFLGILFLDIVTVNRFCSKVKSLNFDAGVFTHLGHIIGVTICIFLVYLFVRVLGELFTNVFPIQISTSDLPIIQTALGIMLFTFLLFLLGIIGLLNPFILVPICFLTLAFYWRQAFQIIKSTLITPIKIPKELNAIGVFSFLFLALFLVFNYVQVLRPFPIGADSLRFYANIPSLIADYGGLVDGNQPYNWSIFMSTGLTIFRRMDVVLGLSFLGGLLSLLALFQLSKKWLDVNYSALVLLLFYSLPMINFLSYMDMKIDMGLMFIVISILLIYYNWMVPAMSNNGKEMTKGLGLMKAKSFFKDRIPVVLKQNRLLVLIGLLAGFAFGIKLTVLFFFLALYCSIWFYKGGKLTFWASFFLCFGAILLLQLDSKASLRQFHQNVSILQWSLLLVGISLIVYLFIKQKQKLIELTTYSLIIGSFFVLPILPWLGKNFSETKQISITALLNGKRASPTFKLDNLASNSQKGGVIIPGLYQMPDPVEPVKKTEKKEKTEKTEKTENGKKKVKKKNKIKKSSASEDMHRFMGYEVMPARYLSLPYDVFVKTNIPKFFIDVGFVLLLLFPILFLFPGKDELGLLSILSKFSFLVLSVLLLLISIPSAFLNQNNLSSPEDGLALLASKESSGLLGNLSDFTNSTLLRIYAPIDSWLEEIVAFKDPVTYPLLLLLFLLIVPVVYVRIKRHSKETQSIVLFMVIYFFLWWILGSGAAWYGILIFSLPFIFLLKSISFKGEEVDTSKPKLNVFRSLKKGSVLLIALVWVLLAFTQRAANYEPIDEERAKRIYFPSILNYQMGNYNEDKLMDYHFPNVRQLVKMVNRDKRALVYMVGSPFNFFIHKNDSRVLSDTYLDFFDLLINQAGTKEKVIGKLKSEGFRYIIFDLNMTSYDVTPGKTLTRKFTQFMNTLYDNPGVELVATDRRIKLYDSGQEIFDVFQDKGSIVKSGTVAIFKIK